MTTVFVTSSGTDVGKTHVTTLLLAALEAAGYRARALKPVASGFDESQPDATDTGRLLLAQGLPPTPENVASISPWRFTAPLSPDMAAARERRTIPFDALLAFCRAPTNADITLIEGIGGVMVPLDSEHTVLDWIAALGAPVLLVVGSYLGSLSHSLSAASVLRARGCSTAAVIVSESEEQPVPLDETCAALARFLGPVPVHGLARRAGDASPDGATLLRLVEPLLR